MCRCIGAIASSVHDDLFETPEYENSLFMKFPHNSVLPLAVVT